MKHNSRDKKILVTGAGGYIGRYVVDALIQLGFSVIAVGKDLSKVDNQVFKIERDIFSIDGDLYSELGSPDICLHLAWQDGFVHNSDSHLRFLHAHYKFITQLIDGGVQHMCIMGSMHEVGYHVGAIDEHTPTNPLSLYGISKNSLRQSIESYVSNKSVVFQWIRAFYIYGDDLNSCSIFSKILQADKLGNEFFPFTSGKNKYDFIALEDLATQISLVAAQDKVTGIINCCSGIPRSLAEVVEEYLIKSNLKIRLKYGEFPDRPYDSPEVWGNDSKIQQIIMNG